MKDWFKIGGAQTNNCYYRKTIQSLKRFEQNLVFNRNFKPFQIIRSKFFKKIKIKATTRPFHIYLRIILLFVLFTVVKLFYLHCTLINNNRTIDTASLRGTTYNITIFKKV